MNCCIAFANRSYIYHVAQQATPIPTLPPRPMGYTKTEMIHRRCLWKSLESVEFAALEWVDRLNHRRLLGPIRYRQPTATVARYYANLEANGMAA
jgi:hypothetical protein